MWAKVTLPPANGVSQPRHHAVDHALPQTPPLLQVPYGAAGVGLRPAAVRKGGGWLKKSDILQRGKIKAGRSPLLADCFQLIIYPGPSAPGNFAPGHWARTPVRSLLWDK